MEKGYRTSKSATINGLSLDDTIYRPDLSMRRHGHAEAALSVVLSGSYAEKVGRLTRECTPGVVVIHPPDEEHAVAFGDRSTRIFRVELNATWLERIRTHSGIVDEPLMLRNIAVEGLATRLHREFCGSDACAPLAIEGLLLELIALATRGAVRPDKGLPEWLKRVQELLHERFREDLNLSAVADAVAIHPGHVATTFRKRFGMTLGEYIRKLRIEYSQDQIERTERPLTDIALSAGFSDQSHFNRWFKRIAGVTPAQYRRRRRAS